MLLHCKWTFGEEEERTANVPPKHDGGPTDRKRELQSTNFTLIATRDNYIREGVSRDQRSASIMQIGRNNRLDRSLLFFDFTSVPPQSQPLQRATITMSILVRDPSLRPCTVSDPDSCIQVHLATKIWGETEAVTNWTHNAFPEEWDTLGGDFIRPSFGLGDPASEDPLIVSCTLDVDVIQSLIDDPGSNLGFVLRNDNNGWTQFATRDCRSASCGRSPTLTLTFSPVNRETSSPTKEPTSSPSQNPSMETGTQSTPPPREQCELFRQGLTLLSSFTVTQRRSFQDAWELVLEDLGLMYAVNPSSVTILADVQNVQQTQNGEGYFQTLVIYQMCYVEISQGNLQTNYVEEHLAYMKLRSNRLVMERRLIDLNIVVQPSTLQEAILADIPVSSNCVWSCSLSFPLLLLQGAVLLLKHL